MMACRGSYELTDNAKEREGERERETTWIRRERFAYSEIGGCVCLTAPTNSGTSGAHQLHAAPVSAVSPWSLLGVPAMGAKSDHPTKPEFGWV